MGQAKQRGSFEQRKAQAEQANVILTDELKKSNSASLKPATMTMQQFRLRLTSFGFIKYGGKQEQQ